MFGMELKAKQKQNKSNKGLWVWLWKRLHENKFNSDDDLPLNKLLKFHIMTIIIRCVINENGKL